MSKLPNRHLCPNGKSTDKRAKIKGEAVFRLLHLFRKVESNVWKWFLLRILIMIWRTGSGCRCLKVCIKGKRCRPLRKLHQWLQLITTIQSRLDRPSSGEASSISLLLYTCLSCWISLQALGQLQCEQTRSHFTYLGNCASLNEIYDTKPMTSHLFW